MSCAVMYVNLVLALGAVAGALTLLHNQAPDTRRRLDIPGVLTVSGGLFAVVFGLSHAQTTSWTNPVTLAALIAGVLLLAVFGGIESRTSHALRPLRVLADRNRAGSFVSIGIAAASMFGVFLFLTYYLQQTRGFSPLLSGVAFLPMTLAVMVTATLATTKLGPRVGPRPLVTGGMPLGAVASAEPVLAH